jgi:hypothetical protein
MSLIIAIAASMPLPPPPQIIPGSGSIPESRNAPLIAIDRDVPPARWSCRAQLTPGGAIQIGGTFGKIEADPIHVPVPRWAPFTMVVVEPDRSHRFEGTYIATHTPVPAAIYGFRFSQDSRVYEVTVRSNGFATPGIIEFQRFEDGEWVDAGRGSCSGAYEPAPDAAQ